MEKQRDKAAKRLERKLAKQSGADPEATDQPEDTVGTPPDESKPPEE